MWQSLKDNFDVNNVAVKKYIKRLAYHSKGPIYELFLSQRGSLRKLFNDNKGCVINLPTSSGKTRIAELAILDCVIDSNDKVLYLAPFRSLSFEVENIFEETFSDLNIVVSHLYGGSVYSNLDRETIESSQVIVATPEKAKAILRGNPTLFSQIKLVIIDEGHLLGAEKRHIVNEMFYEELRLFVSLNQGRIVLLSAVLPNPEDLALWIAQDENQVYKNDWRPSGQRLGIIEWKGKETDIKWLATEKTQESFNNKFILSSVKGNKNKATAEVAYRFNDFGSVLVFVGQKRSVFTIAKEYAKCIKNTSSFIYEDQQNWKAFELACIEAFGEKSDWLKYAKQGILCHNADLITSVRMPLEKLMRTEKPRLIVATSTLAQGVNLGVSTVIFSTLSQARSPLSTSSFWNIAGRAGRAFVDSEGKILITQDLATKKKWEIKNDDQKIVNYTKQANVERAESGILTMINALYRFAEKHQILFDNLISLIADNNPNNIDPEIQTVVRNMVDWIDDSLLSLHMVNNDTEIINYQWIDDYFRSTLAYIQAEKLPDQFGANVISFFKFRAKSIVHKLGNDRNIWRSFVNASVPVNCNLEIEQRKKDIVLLLQNSLSLPSIEVNIIELVKKIEELLNNISHINHICLESKDSDLIRECWILGNALQCILPLENASFIINNHYGMNLPWILNAITRKLELEKLTEEAELLSKISIFIEYGLPNVLAIKVYQAGIRSRVSAVELSSFFIGGENNTISWFRRALMEGDFHNVTESSREWLDLFKESTISKVKIKSNIKNFSLPENSFGTIKSNMLFAKQVNGKQYLHSPDYGEVKEVLNTEEFNFTEISNIEGVRFFYDEHLSSWVMQNENPNIQIKMDS